MTIWKASVGEILELSADTLVCSGNPQLNLSGGVGGELLRRYGAAMQQFLHDWLRQRSLRYVTPGTVVAAPSCGTPFRVVLHAVAIDAFYDTSPELIAQTYDAAFAEASRLGCRTVASTCLACGYGRATPEMFLAAVRRSVGRSIEGIDQVEFRSTNADVIDAVCHAIALANGHRTE